MVTLIAIQLKEIYQLTPMSTAWYQKNNEATFSDIIAFVRRIIWSDKYFSKSENQDELVKIKGSELKALINQLAATG